MIIRINDKNPIRGCVIIDKKTGDWCRCNYVKSAGKMRIYSNHWTSDTTSKAETIKYWVRHKGSLYYSTFIKHTNDYKIVNNNCPACKNTIEFVLASSGNKDTIIRFEHSIKNKDLSCDWYNRISVNQDNGYDQFLMVASDFLEITKGWRFVK